MEDRPSQGAQGQVSDQETSEAIKLAWQMYEQEKIQTQNKQALIDAHRELGLPPGFIERATAELRVRRAAGQHRRHLILAAGLGAAVALCSFGVVSSLRQVPAVPVAAAPVIAPSVPAPTMPASSEANPEPEAAPASKVPVFDFRRMPENAWQVRSNPGSAGGLRYLKEKGNRWARLEVRRFHSDAGGPFRGQYWVSLRHENDPMDLRAYQSVTIRARGRGLENIRFAFWGNGPHLWTEIWNSPTATLTPDWKEYTFAFSDFSYAVRKTVAAPFLSTEWVRPKRIGAIEVETGVYVNPVSAHRAVEIANISFH